jgi:hypothetical protein
LNQANRKFVCHVKHRNTPAKFNAEPPRAHRKCGKVL